MQQVILNKDAVKFSEDILTYNDPEYVYIPLINEEINLKDNVLKNEQVFKNNKLITTPISGKILGINKTNHIVIENDYKEKKLNKKNVFSEYKIENIKDILKSNGYNDLLDKFTNANNIEAIIFNSFDYEPYVKNRIMYVKERTQEILDLFEVLIKHYKTKINKMVIKANETKTIEECLNMIGTYPKINISLVNDNYLFGYERFIAEYLGIKNNYLYLDILDVIKIIDLLKYRNISSTKHITISGNALETSYVFNTKKYVLASDLLDFIKYPKKDVVYFANNIMLNNIIDIKSLVITDEIESIHIMKKKRIKVYKCNNCGLCNRICPLNIDLLSKTDIDRCINCGLCSYICPANINLKNYLKGEK